MLLELVLFSVVIVTGYQAYWLLRNAGRVQRPYAFMLIANGLLALFSFADLHEEEPSAAAHLLGFIAVGAFVFLVVVPGFLRTLARVALAADSVGLAMRLLAMRELLQPGLGARQEREFLSTIADVRAGRTDQALDALRAHKAKVSEPMHRRVLDERIILTMLYARRWRDALDVFEASPGVNHSATSPQLLMELVRAYGESGDLDRAAEVMEFLEDSAVSGTSGLGLGLMRTRLVFLAFVGRTAAVEALCTSGAPLGVLPPAVKSYWTGVARMQSGDADGARRALNDSIVLARSDARAKEIAAETLTKLDTGVALPVFLPAVTELADRVMQAALRVERGPRAPRLDAALWHVAPVTLGIVIANVLVSIVVAVTLGSLEDPGVLARAGANFRPAVLAGDWWRLHASTFLHAGAVHLILNMYSLWMLGKLVEQILGRVRFFAIYSLAGLGGAVASLLLGEHSGVSVGASGAVFGILGAALVELGLRRRIYPELWRRALFGNLLLLLAANLIAGFYFPAIDQSAHLGGLVVGVLLTLVLSPNTRFGAGRPIVFVATLLAAVSVVSVAYSAWGVVSAMSEKTWKRRTVGGVSLEVPPSWVLVDKNALLAPSYGQARTLFVAQSPREVEATLDAVADQSAGETVEMFEQGEKVKQVSSVAEPPPVPVGWAVRQLRITLDLGPYHAFVAVHFEGNTQITVLMFVPEARLEDARAIMPKILESAHL